MKICIWCNKPIKNSLNSNQCVHKKCECNPFYKTRSNVAGELGKSKRKKSLAELDFDVPRTCVQQTKYGKWPKLNEN